MADKGKAIVDPALESPEEKTDESAPGPAIDKGKGPSLEPEVSDLMNLKPSDLDRPIEVKVYRKWMSKNIPDPNPTGLCFILLDKNGTAIQANVRLWDMKIFDTKLQPGFCYKIERFGCKKTENWQRTLNNPMTLLLGKYTQVTQIEDHGFPEHHFSFVAYNELGRRADAKDYTLTGTIHSRPALKKNITVHLIVTTNRILRRNVDIQNLNGNVLTLTLWNEMATDFPTQTLAQMEQPIIIAASSCWAKRFSGGLQLSATPATHYYLNPRLEETDRIRQVYDELGFMVEPLQLPATDMRAMDRPSAHRLTPVNMLTQATPENITQQFTTRATIVRIDEQSAWYFDRCRICGNKIAETMPHRHCQQPGMKPLPNYSYSFRIIIADETGSVMVTCFSPQADSFLAIKVSDLISYIPEPNPLVLPPIIQQLENTTHVFQVHLAKGSRRGFPRFILDGVENGPPPALPPNPPETEEGASFATAESGIQTPIVTDTVAGIITPPPQSDEPVEKERETAEMHSTTVRRELFQPTGDESPSRSAKKPKLD